MLSETKELLSALAKKKQIPRCARNDNGGDTLPRWVQRAGPLQKRKNERGLGLGHAALEGQQNQVRTAAHAKFI